MLKEFSHPKQYLKHPRMQFIKEKRVKEKDSCLKYPF